MSVDTCQEVVELITAYFEEALTTEDRLAFERHVAVCPPCRAYMSQMRTVLRVAGTLSEADLSDAVRTRLLGAFADWRERSSR
jgi:anti-sigma factor RsiW